MRTLPEPLRRVFEANAAYLTEQAIDARPAALAAPSDPDHFLDMDAFGRAYPFDAISRVEAENLARFGKDIAAKGRVPWQDRRGLPRPRPGLPRRATCRARSSARPPSAT